MRIIILVLLVCIMWLTDAKATRHISLKTIRPKAIHLYQDDNIKGLDGTPKLKADKVIY